MGIKVKREATKERKNALGRKVVVNRNASGNEAVSKTRTVYSKSGGVISEKKSYKDRGSVAGKLLERKVDKSIAKRDRANEKQESLRRKESIKNAAMEGAKMGAAKPVAKQSNRIDNKIERLENRKQRIGSDKGMNKRQFERAGNIRKKIYELNKKRTALRLT